MKISVYFQKFYMILLLYLIISAGLLDSQVTCFWQSNGEEIENICLLIYNSSQKLLHKTFLANEKIITLELKVGISKTYFTLGLTLYFQRFAVIHRQRTTQNIYVVTAHKNFLLQSI